VNSAQVSSTSTEPDDTGLVVSGAERRLAVEHWLLQAASDPRRARQEWRRDGVALLRCGGLFGAVRLTVPLVHAAAGTGELGKVDEYLAQTLLDGPVFLDQRNHSYYVLVGVSMGRLRALQRPCDVAAFLGRHHFLGVPDPSFTDPSRRCYWCVEMDSPADLTAANAVLQLVSTGRERLRNERRGN
jgi:hypothetical protein